VQFNTCTTTIDSTNLVKITCDMLIPDTTIYPTNQAKINFDKLLCHFRKWILNVTQPNEIE